MVGWSIFLSVVLTLLLLLCGFLFLPIQICLSYDNEVSIKVKLFFFSYSIYPEKKNKNVKKSNKNKKKSAETSHKASKVKTSEEKDSFFEMLSFYREVFENVLLPALNDLGKYLVIRIKRLRIDIATGDAAKTAIAYSAACNGINSLLLLFNEYCTLKVEKTEDVGIFCRYDLSSSSGSGEIIFSLRIFHAIKILIPALLEYIEEREKFEDALPQRIKKTN